MPRTEMLYTYTRVHISANLYACVQQANREHVQYSTHTPKGAGLLHISKEFEQELFAPSSKFHFSGRGSFIGVSTEHIQRHPTDE